MKLGDIPTGAGEGQHIPHMRLSNKGLLLGRGVLLAKMDEDGLCIEEDRILTLLAIAQKAEVPQPTIRAIDRASYHWRSGDKVLAAIHLAQIGLKKIDEEDGERLVLAAELLDAGMSAAELANELGLKIQPRAKKYDDDQPRVPAGSGRESGRWTSGSGEAAGGSDEAPLVEDRSAGGRPVNRVRELPKDAIVVTRPDGSTIDDPKSPTGKLMAPPQANFKEVYAAGERIANWPLMQQYDPRKIALQQFGTYDFQRDKATNSFFDEYVPAANYAIGVYMAGAGYSLPLTYAIAQRYAMGNSSNWYKYWSRGRPWIKSGWDDARAGDWKTR